MKSENHRITWGKELPIPEESIIEIVKGYLTGSEMQRLEMYEAYYKGDNADIVKRYKDKAYRGKTPNNKVPSGYYSTIIDSMSGYLFNNVQYVNKDNEAYSESLKQILYDNDVEVKDMNSGTMALAYNKAIELVYTVGDANNTEIKFCNIEPEQMILIYDNSIEPEVIAGIYLIKSPEKDYDYYIDVIYKDLWQYWKMSKKQELTQREQDRMLFFSKCPVICYNTEILNCLSSFNIIIPYIDALDYVLSGNSNEMERLVDTILKLSMLVSPEDAKNMTEWKYIQGLQKDDVAEYIQKDTSPAFREYVSKLLINEIHKHSHVLDWYSPDSGTSGEVSGKALLTRLYDMELYSNRIEKVYRKGAWKRIELITELMAAKSMPTGEIDIIFKRTQPNMMLDTLQALKDIPFISDETKREIAGIDEAKEKDRLEEQSKSLDITDLIPKKEVPNGVSNQEKTNQEKIVDNNA